MEVIVDTYLGKADEDGWWRFAGRLKDHPNVIVTFLFSDDNDRKKMRDSLLAGQKPDCGVHEDLVEEITIDEA